MGLPRHPRIGSLTVGSVLSEMPRRACPVAPDARIVDALRLMVKNQIGAVAVIDGVTVCGIFTQQMYAQAVAIGAISGDAAAVSEVMASCPIIAAPEQAVHDCLEQMQRLGISCLPVVDQGQWLGLLSVEDLQAAQIRQYERVFHELELDLKIMFLQGTYSC